MALESAKLDELCVNTIRMLAVDMVEKANSGHPGLPLGAAPIAYVLWDRFLRHNPADPGWAGRDRFILSAGHGSALIYALLHLYGYDLSVDQLKNFRQWDSLTPGHPEYGLTPGVESTTGPLGQGFAMGVGMAMAQRYLAGQYDRDGFDVMDHYIYGLVSDGDLMEGVASEAASLAGTLGLGKLIYLYDDNHISIEGSTDLAFTEDAAARFRAYHWQVIEVADAGDLDAIAEAIKQAQADGDHPSLIKVRSHIGFGSPKQDQAASHGEPLGAEGMAKTREFFGWPEEPFSIPQEALAHTRQALDRGKEQQAAWNSMFDSYGQAHAGLADTLKAQLAGVLPEGWEGKLPVFAADDGPLATRAASGKVLGALAPVITNLVGGSADLAPSNKTMLDGTGDMRGKGADCGRNIHFGVREHAMGAMVNGMALHGGLLPYAGTFFVFSDFMRPSLRLAALMEVHSIFIFTHDSIGVGEDGPTHQPVEHLASLRAMPGLSLIRPADANETAAAWSQAVSAGKPVCLLLSRQKLPILDAADGNIAQGVAKGAYVLDDCDGQPDILLLSSGAEVHLALSAKAELEAGGAACRVVSMPSWDLFAAQDQAYRDQVLPPAVKARLAVEAGATFGWERYVGMSGKIIGLDRFGASAPGGVIFEKLGFSVANVVAQAKELLGQ